MSRGFTLLELVVSLTVLSLLGGVAVLAWSSQPEPEPSALAGLRAARARAVLEGRAVAWRSGTTVVRFLPDGSSSGGSVTVDGADVTVSVLDGVLHAQR